MKPYQEYIKNKDDIIIQEVGRKNSDLGRSLGISKYAVHWMTLEPHQRSSSPHAEKLEEEFVYVIKGNPHVWINGYIYPLKPGSAVGFPAGTGIAHTFINNTNEEIEFIVLGDKTKKENKCSFPINPELFEECKNIWWSDFPKQEFGPHDGKVGNLDYQKDPSEISFIKNVYDLKRTTYI